FFQISERPHRRTLPGLLHDGNHVHGDVPRARVALEAIEDAPTIDHRKLDVQGDRRRLQLIRQGEPGVAARGHDRLETLPARHPHQDPGELRVILDDEEDPVTLSQVLAIILDRALDGLLWRRRRHLREEACRRLWPRLLAALGELLGCRAGPLACRMVLYLGLRSEIRVWQVQGERAPLARLALHLDLAAEQAGDLARDGKAQSGAAVLAAGGPVRLLERLEGDPLLVAGDADARV